MDSVGWHTHGLDTLQYIIQKGIFLTSFLPQKCSNINTCVCDPEFSGIDCSVRAIEIWYDIIIILNIPSSSSPLYTIIIYTIIIYTLSKPSSSSLSMFLTIFKCRFANLGLPLLHFFLLPVQQKQKQVTTLFCLEQIGDLGFRGQNRCMIYNKPLQTDPITEKMWQKYHRWGFALTSLSENYRIDPLR